MLILAIETSCDDTSASVLLDGRNILSNVVSSQISIHQKYGGVVPELASRKHIESIVPVVKEALKIAQVTLKDIGGIAVTQGPGLIGSLLVGVSFAKSLAFSAQIPLIGVNHIEAHLSAIFLEHEAPRFPYLGMVVSGGHTAIFRVNGFGSYILLGQTRDDAAGEAFDKVAKFLGLGYPGGPVIEEWSKKGNPNAIRFPKPYLGKDSLDFSFSGIKTAVVNYIKTNYGVKENFPESLIKDVASSFQEVVVEILVQKILKAAKAQGLKRIVLSGGVAANQYLRQKIKQEAKEEKLKIYIPSPGLCTDNAAMVGVVGYEYLKRGLKSSTTLNAYSNINI
jgi:N6-L-threonylcarbamoyladenine synthase